MSVSLGEAIEKLLKVYKIEKPVRQNEALYYWSEIVGENIARHTTAEKVDYGKLYVRVDSPVWRNELSFQKEEILKKINERLKNAHLKEIVLR